MSASPAPQGGSGQQQQQGNDQIHFKFCREWYTNRPLPSYYKKRELRHANLCAFCSSNLLYPKEDRATNSLVFACRTCHVAEPATSYCVFQNKLHSQVGDTAGVTQDIGNDPTVGLPLCLLCGDLICCDSCGSFAEYMTWNEPAQQKQG